MSKSMIRAQSSDGEVYVNRRLSQQIVSGAKNKDLYVSSIEKAFQVLNAFGRNAPELSLSDIAKVTELTIPNVQRLTHTLITLGLLGRDERTKKFFLTPKTLDLGYRYLQTNALLDRATPYLAELNRKTEETVNLTILDGTEIVYIARHRGFRTISVNLYVGARIPAFPTSVGQVILAFTAPAQALKTIQRSKRVQYTRYTITDPSALMNKLERIRELGYALEDQEMFLGGISVAAPILDNERNALAAINIAVPTSRFTALEAEKKFARVLLEAGRAISDPL
jgi:PcaR/PcaU/PobR family beta-ketoadipate pathway transcriptional regulator